MRIIKLKLIESIENKDGITNTHLIKATVKEGGIFGSKKQVLTVVVTEYKNIDSFSSENCETGSIFTFSHHKDTLSYFIKSRRNVWIINE